MKFFNKIVKNATLDVKLVIMVTPAKFVRI